MGLQILYLAILFVCVASADDRPGCQIKCGDISVQYPFGLEEGCAKDPSFVLNCSHSSTPPTLVLFNIPVLNISIEEGTSIVQLDIKAYTCYNEFGVVDDFAQWAIIRGSPFTFSNTRNKFTAIGCNVVAYFSDTKVIEGLTTGCVSTCSNNTLIDASQHLTSCSGVGCCQIPIPDNLDTFHISVKPVNASSIQLNYSYCFFGFLTDTTWFDKSSSFSLADTPQTLGKPHVLLDWAIREKSCGGDPNEYICGENTNCANSTNGPGYRCLCNQGYKGNPYTLKGCQDIDECWPGSENIFPCKGTCKNTPGNYTCHCSFGQEGDGKVGCRLKTVIKVFVETMAIGSSSSSTPKVTKIVIAQDRPEKFKGANFMTWQSKMMFYLTTFGLERFLSENAHTQKEGKTPEINKEVYLAIDSWNHSDFLCRNYILNSLNEVFYKD